MKRLYVKRAFRIFGFLILSAVLWWFGCRTLIMKRDDGILPMQNFYQQPEGTVDVLILGSSHAGVNIDLETIWRNYGYSAYTLWGSSQPFWNTYHFMVEALKYQSPKVIVVDVYASVYQHEYADNERQVTNTEGMRLSLNKVKAIMVTAPQDRWADLILSMPIYHKRYRELDAEDFRHYPWNIELSDFKGGSTRYGSNWTVPIEYSYSDAVTPMTEKEEEYFRKIISLAHDREIPLILIKTPTSLQEEQQPYYNYVKQVAAEYDEPVYILNEMTDILGLETPDFSIDNSHLNTQGARKVGNWLGGMLAKYDLTDHRGDERYVSWEHFCRNSDHTYLTQITELKDWLAEVERDGYGLVIAPGAATDITPDVQDRLGQYVYVSTEGDLCGSLVTVSQNDGIVLWLNGDEVFRTREEGWFFAAYDPAVGEFVDYAMFESVNGSWMQRKEAPNLLDYQ